MLRISQTIDINQVDIYREALFAGMFGAKYDIDNVGCKTLRMSIVSFICNRLDEFRIESNDFVDDYNIYVDIDNLNKYGTDRKFVKSLSDYDDFVFCGAEHFNRIRDEYIVAIQTIDDNDYAVNRSFFYVTYLNFRIMFIAKNILKPLRDISTYYENFSLIF